MKKSPETNAASFSRHIFLFDTAPAEAVYDFFTIMSAPHLGMDTDAHGILLIRKRRETEGFREAV